MHFLREFRKMFKLYVISHFVCKAHLLLFLLAVRGKFSRDKGGDQYIFSLDKGGSIKCPAGG